MATAATETKYDLGEDDRVVMPATWRTYLRLLADRGERNRPKYTYLDGRLTALSPGVPHELYKVRLGALLDEILVGLRIEFRPLGSVTLLKGRRSREGAEADLTYYLTNLEKFKGQQKLVMGVDPPPDLAVEVVVSHSEGDALEAYRRFGVREVWVVKETGLEFRALGGEGDYALTAVSRHFPFLSSDELAGWLFRDDVEDEGTLRREFRAWVADTLARRL